MVVTRGKERVGIACLQAYEHKVVLVCETDKRTQQTTGEPTFLPLDSVGLQSNPIRSDPRRHTDPGAPPRVGSYPLVITRGGLDTTSRNRPAAAAAAPPATPSVTRCEYFTISPKSWAHCP